MSAKFVDIPADEWEKEFFAEELKEDRKADRSARVKASNFAAAFDALFEVAGFIPEARLPLHIFLSQTKGKAPDEQVMFCETDAGRLLPGEEGVAIGSLRKRWVRAWKDILVPEMARTGKRLGRRINGSIELATRHRKEKKSAPVYFSEIAQAIVDVERAASRMNGKKRDERFRQAALEVWANLPACIAPEQKEKARTEPEKRKKALAGRNTRRMTRWQNVTQEMIAEAEAESPKALETLRARLHAELETMFADAETVTKSDAPVENEICDFPEQNDVSRCFTVDEPVHVEPLPTPGYCVACGRPIPPERQKIDSERCKQCVESEYWRAAPLRAVKTQERIL